MQNQQNQFDDFDAQLQVEEFYTFENLDEEYSEFFFEEDESPQ